MEIGIGKYLDDLENFQNAVQFCIKKISKKEQFHVGTSTVCTYLYLYILSNTKVHTYGPQVFSFYFDLIFKLSGVMHTPPLPKKYFSRKRNLIGKNTKLKTALRL